MDIDELLVDKIMKIKDDDNFIIGVMAFLQTDKSKKDMLLYLEKMGNRATRNNVLNLAINLYDRGE